MCLSSSLCGAWSATGISLLICVLYLIILICFVFPFWIVSSLSFGSVVSPVLRKVKVSMGTNPEKGKNPVFQFLVKCAVKDLRWPDATRSGQKETFYRNTLFREWCPLLIPIFAKSGSLSVFGVHGRWGLFDRGRDTLPARECRISRRASPSPTSDSGRTLEILDLLLARWVISTKYKRLGKNSRSANRFSLSWLVIWRLSSCWMS